MSKRVIFYLVNSVVFLLAFIVFWLELTVLYENPLVIISFNPADLVKIVYMAITLAFITLPITLLIAVHTDTKHLYGLYLLAAASSLIMFYPLPIIALILALGTLLSLYLFDRSSTKALNNQLSFKPYEIFRRSLGSFITLMAVVISLGYYTSILDKIHQFTLTIPDEMFNKVIEAVGEQFQETSPQTKEQRLEKATDKIYEEQVKPQVLQKLAQAGITDPEKTQPYLDQAKKDLEKQAQEQMTNIPVDADQTLIKQVKKQTQDNINNLLQQYRQFLPALFSFSLFALFQFLDPFVAALVTGLLFGIVKTLTSLEVMHIETKETKAEILTL